MDGQQSRIYLIEKKSYFKKINDREYESGWWPITEETAGRLVGALIFFHEEKKKPSFFGGTVLGYRIETEGEHKDRLVFRLESSSDCKAIKTGPEGWSQSIKIVWAETAPSAVEA